MAHYLIGHYQHREPVRFAQIERGYGLEEKLLGRSRSKRYDFIMTMRPPPGLHHVTLCPKCRQPGRGTRPLNVHHDTRGLQYDPEPEVFHHQAKSGTRCRSHTFRPGAGSAENGGHCSNLVLHLYEDPADFREPFCHVLRYLGGRGDGIPGKKAAPGGKRPLRARLIPVQKMLSGENCMFHKDIRTG